MSTGMRYGVLPAVCFDHGLLVFDIIVLSVDTNMSEEHAIPEMMATANKTIKCHIPEEHKLSNG